MRALPASYSLTDNTISEQAHRELLDRNWELHEVAGPGAGTPAR
jgi:hypothetical protein